MAKIRFNGPITVSFSSFLTLISAAFTTYLKRAAGQRLEPSWNAEIEVGIRFWRQQFTKAMQHRDIRKGREIFDSLQTDTNDEYDVTVETAVSVPGAWYHPRLAGKNKTILYFHGGGYTFSGPISERFAAMFAHHTQARLFASSYRLTPEHPHPAQAEDALAAWKYVTSEVPASQVVVLGDSAGGHMALMLLQTLKREGLPQPALCIGLCPWTDIGDRGESLHENDYYDLVQGWMAIQFGKWLDPENAFGRKALSPIYHDYAGLAPMYLQSGGREILRDMIKEFAEKQLENGADIMLDQWDDMPHNFHAYDSMKRSASHALQRIKEAIDACVGNNGTGLRQQSITLLQSADFGKMKQRTK